MDKRSLQGPTTSVMTKVYRVSDFYPGSTRVPAARGRLIDPSADPRATTFLRNRGEYTGRRGRSPRLAQAYATAKTAKTEERDVQRVGYEVTSDFEATHWWFLSRRDLFLGQVQIAAEQIRKTRPESSVGLSLLDYGCGTGFNLRFLSQFGDVTGADVAPESLVEFQKARGYPLFDLRGDTSALEGAFDIITALDVLEHLDDDVGGLKMLATFLKPRGQIVLTVPAYDWLWGGEDEISLHKRRYTKRTLTRTCRAAGFDVLFSSYFNLSILPLAAVSIWSKRALSGRRALQESNLRPTPAWMNRLLYEVTAFENRRVGRGTMSLPAGASLVCRLEPIRP
jgi:SAM-dependent methyltransferase